MRRRWVVAFVLPVLLGGALAVAQNVIGPNGRPQTQFLHIPWSTDAGWNNRLSTIDGCFQKLAANNPTCAPSGGGGGTPGTPTGALQWNSAGSFAGTTNIATDGATGLFNPATALPQSQLIFGNPDVTINTTTNSATGYTETIPGPIVANAAITGTLPHVPVAPGSVTFRPVGDGQTVSDDGAGNLAGSTGSGGTNTIDYATGAFSFSFGGSDPADTAAAWNAPGLGPTTIFQGDGRVNFPQGVLQFFGNASERLSVLDTGSFVNWLLGPPTGGFGLGILSPDAGFTQDIALYGQGGSASLRDGIPGAFTNYVEVNPTAINVAMQSGSYFQMTTDEGHLQATNGSHTSRYDWNYEHAIYDFGCNGDPACLGPPSTNTGTDSFLIALGTAQTNAVNNAFVVKGGPTIVSGPVTDISSSAHVGHVVCVVDGTGLYGHCTSVVGAGGDCTCVAN